MRMVPYMPLFSSTMMLLPPYCAAVASSCPFIRKSPSPAIVKAVRPGQQVGRDAGRHAVAHRARRSAPAASCGPWPARVAEEAVHPAGEVAGAVGQHRVGRQQLLQHATMAGMSMSPGSFCGTRLAS
jgi:hypothetical protein